MYILTYEISKISNYLLIFHAALLLVSAPSKKKMLCSLRRIERALFKLFLTVTESLGEYLSLPDMLYHRQDVLPCAFLNWALVSLEIIDVSNGLQISVSNDLTI